MEAKLFFVSIWCGVYGLALRGLRKAGKEDTTPFMTALNGFFWGTAGFLIGMLLASYRNQMEFSFSFGLRFFVLGFFIGAVRGYLISKKDEEAKNNLLKDNLEWADTGFSAILLASIFMFFVIQAFKIPSGSMRMTFVEGDHLFVNKFIYGIRVPFSDKKLFHFRPVKNGDIVIFRFPAKDKSSEHYGKDFIKRAIALEGQTVEIVDKQLILDGERISEPYKQNTDPAIYPRYYERNSELFQEYWEQGKFAGNHPEIRDNFGPVTIPKGYVFVLGDNRDESYDSRFWGPLPIDKIKGRAWFRYWGPVDREKAKKNPLYYFWRIRLVH